MARTKGAIGKKTKAKLKKKSAPVVKKKAAPPAATPPPEQTEIVFHEPNRTDFDAGLDLMQKKIETDEDLAANQVDPIEELKQELAQEMTAVEDVLTLPQAQGEAAEWHPPTKMQIDRFHGLGGLTIKGVDVGSVYWKKNQQAKIQAELKPKLKGILAEIYAIYLPEATGASEKTVHTIALLAGLADIMADHTMRIMTLQPEEKSLVTASPAA